MPKIALTKGKFAIVDDEDYEYLNQWKWTFLNTGYVMRRIQKKGHKTKYILMHRLILNTPKGMITDHINRNRLDNRRENLRICTPSQNLCNTNLRKDNTSGHRGVYWYKPYSKWMVICTINSKSKFLGYFEDKSEAIRVYKENAKIMHGSFVGGQE